MSLGELLKVQERRNAMIPRKRFTAKVGHLFINITGNGGFRTPDHPDYEPEMFNWFIAPDDEDKSYRRALAEGCESTHAQALAAVRAAMHEIVAEIFNGLESL